MSLVLSLAMADEGDLSGYAELRGSYSHDLEGTPWVLVERLRPTLEVEPHPRARVVVTPQLALPQGRYDQREAMDLLDAQAGALLDLAGCDLSVPDRVQTVGDVLTLERFYMDFYAPKADIRVGRQALNWGSAMFINPTDLFAQNLVAQPWQERQGVNAVRVTVPFGSHQLLAMRAWKPRGSCTGSPSPSRVMGMSTKESSNRMRHPGVPTPSGGMPHGSSYRQKAAEVLGSAPGDHSAALEKAWRGLHLVKEGAARQSSSVP